MLCDTMVASYKMVVNEAEDEKYVLPSVLHADEFNKALLDA